MDITPLPPKGQQIINRYGNGGFVVNEKIYKGNILVMADQVFPWDIKDIKKATPESFQLLTNLNPHPEIILIGTGNQFTPLAAELRNYFRTFNIAADSMDTGAACRTYNVLVSEDRRVAAALIAV